MKRSAATLPRVSRSAAPAVLGLFVLGCAASPSTPASASSSASTPATPVPADPSPASPAANLEPTASPRATGKAFDPAAELATRFESSIFRPAFLVDLPADWFPVERDAAAFQAYFGDEQYEITIDHTYHKSETAAEAMARLLRAPSLTPVGEPEEISIGGKTGLTVVADASAPVEWADSGYHINVPNLRVRLATVPVTGGETVSIFVVANTSANDFPAVDKVARRILATLKWVAAT